MEVILAWISVGLGVAGLAYGIYQNRQKRYIERLATLQAWDIFQSAYQALGWLNNALEESDPKARELTLAKSQARPDSHYTKTIHNLYTHHDKVTPELIDRWINEGRIAEHSRKDFLIRLGEKYDA